MAPTNAHLLMQFKAHCSKETYDLAMSFLQKTRTTMQNTVGSLSAGSAAACVLLASQRLQNDDFDEKSAQKQSSLKPKDFKKLYIAIKQALDEAERSLVISYDELYATYPMLKIWKKEFHPFLDEIENALTQAGETPGTTIFRCTAFFFLWTIVTIKELPGPLEYATGHNLSYKLMSTALSKLRAPPQDVEKTIKAHLKAVKRRETAKLEKAFGTSTPNPPPSAKGTRAPPAAQTQPVASSSSLPSPSRTQPSRHVTRVAQPPPPAHHMWKSGPKRELPSKDSPKKRAPEDALMDIDVEGLSTPSKKRRTISEFVPDVVATPSRVLRTPAKTNPQIFPPSVLRTASPKKPAKVVVADPLQLLAALEDEPDEPQDKRRFRPVYLEHRLWLARDPRLTAKAR